MVVNVAIVNTCDLPGGGGPEVGSRGNSIRIGQYKLHLPVVGIDLVIHHLHDKLIFCGAASVSIPLQARPQSAYARFVAPG